MRTTVRDWQRDWIRDNGQTDDFEVVLSEDSGEEIYSGSFKNIPDSELDKDVLYWGRVADTSAPERIGAYRLVV